MSGLWVWVVAPSAKVMIDLENDSVDQESDSTLSGNDSADPGNGSVNLKNVSMNSQNFIVDSEINLHHLRRTTYVSWKQFGWLIHGSLMEIQRTPIQQPIIAFGMISWWVILPRPSNQQPKLQTFVFLKFTHQPRSIYYSPLFLRLGFLLVWARFVLFFCFPLGFLPSPSNETSRVI